MTTTTMAPGDGGGLRLRELDWMMLAVVGLACFGLAMAVSVQSVEDGGTVLGAMRGQGAKLCVGLVFFLAMAAVPLQWLRARTGIVFAACVLVTASTRVLGPEWNGAHRWLAFGSHNLQPVDFARLALVLIVAHRIAGAGTALGEFRRGFVAVLAPACALAAALLIQPDNGNALLVICLAASLGLAAGLRVRWFVLLGLPGLAVLVAAVTARGYALGRIVGWFSGEPATQVVQGLRAFGHGGFVGQGLGSGWMKLGFVPEARNDFVFTIIGEELGLLGTLTVVTLYAILVGAGLSLALKTRDPFFRYIVLGCTMAIGLQAAVNLMVTTGLVPPKGIDLPFVSSGGSNLVACLGAIGLCGNAARSDAAALESGGVSRH